MRLRAGDLRRIIQEEVGQPPVKPSNEYVVRGGQRLLFRRVDEPKSAWRWGFFPKVMYFTDADVYMAPKSLMDRQSWSFRHGDLIVAVDEGQFFKRSV